MKIKRNKLTNELTAKSKNLELGYYNPENGYCNITYDDTNDGIQLQCGSIDDFKQLVEAEIFVLENNIKILKQSKKELALIKKEINKSK